MRPTTNAERQRWQAEALQLLNEVHAKGRKAGLRPLMWQVGQSGIAGRTSSFGAGAGEAEATLRAWAELLDIPIQRAGGITDHVRLYGVASGYGKARRDIAISADIFPDVEERNP